jgi:hypothetical protein
MSSRNLKKKPEPAGAIKTVLSAYLINLLKFLLKFNDNINPFFFKILINLSLAKPQRPKGNKIILYVFIPVYIRVMIQTRKVFFVLASCWLREGFVIKNRKINPPLSEI